MVCNEDIKYVLPDHRVCVHRVTHIQNCYSEEEAARFFWDICCGLRYCDCRLCVLCVVHGKQICHLNLRPDYFIRTIDG